MRRARGERGQILPLAVIALVALLGVAAFAIDVGYAYYAKRQLQAATDAAALAGAQDLPNVSTAFRTAAEYAGDNTPPNLSSFDFTYQAKCTNTSVIAAGCNPSLNPNALVVSGTASTNAWFAKLFGIDHFDVSAHASACSPCSSTPVDIVIAIDRTGSMCTPQGLGGTCTDLDNAKEGVRTMLAMLNPPNAQVGMVAFPPVETTTTDPCAAPYNAAGGGYDGYDSPTRGYVTDTISGGYKAAGALNPTSGLYLHTEQGPKASCIQAGGNTSYSEALRQARAELAAHGRPNVPDYIIFLTDGEANIGSVYGPNDPVYPPGNLDDKQPCHTAVNLANTYKQEGVTMYSIGYALGDNVECTAGGIRNGVHVANFAVESPPTTSYTTLSEIASPGNFYNKADAGQLNTIFAAIATDIGQGSSRLIDDNF
ncbi:MAG TPA: VWA domain-containing protein [Gaiellales bacterium]|jgi:hypothetical protein|nr:VWA domain-containing protein [Gaiellales bacterium]